MPNEFASATITKTGPDKYRVSYGEDSQQFATFYDEAELMPFESEKQGKPVYQNRVMLSLQAPGKLQPTIRKAYLEKNGGDLPDNERWPQAWQAYKNKTEIVHEGTPIDMWPNATLTKADVLNLKARGVHTVEMLAQVSDTNLDSLGMGSRAMRDKAQAYLKNAGGGAEVMRLTAENKTLRDDIEFMKLQLAELTKNQPKGKDSK